MGQYHLSVNIDRREFLDPHQLGDGLKLAEQLGEGGIPAALVHLLAASNGRGGGDLWDGTGDYAEACCATPTTTKAISGSDPVVGRWAGNRIAIIGDYAEAGDLPDPADHADWIYAACRYAQSGDTERAASENRLREHYPAQADEQIRWMREHPYTDISALLVPYLRENCGIELYEEWPDQGWLSTRFVGWRADSERQWREKLGFSDADLTLMATACASDAGLGDDQTRRLSWLAGRLHQMVPPLNAGADAR